MTTPTHDSEIPDDDFQRRHGLGGAAPVVSAAERIAALEATVARLTAPVTDEEAVAVNIAAPWFGRVRVAMDAFLERRMKG